MILRLGSIIRKEFIQILRDRRTLAIILVIPIMQLFLLGYAATTDIKNVPLGVWDQSRSPQSRANCWMHFARRIISPLHTMSGPWTM